MLRERIELSTSPLPRECSTTELPQPLECGGFCHIEPGSARRSGVRERMLGQTGRRPGKQPIPALPCRSRWIVIAGQNHTPDRAMANEDREKAGPKGRAQRLAAELRANLSRRKAQARERSRDTQADLDAETPPGTRKGEAGRSDS